MSEKEDKHESIRRSLRSKFTFKGSGETGDESNHDNAPTLPNSTSPKKSSSTQQTSSFFKPPSQPTTNTTSFNANANSNANSNFNGKTTLYYLSTKIPSTTSGILASSILPPNLQPSFSNPASTILQKTYQNLFLNRLENHYQIRKSTSYFDRRVQCIEFHRSSSFPTTMALASKGGDIVLWNYEKIELHSGFAESGGSGIGNRNNEGEENEEENDRRRRANINEIPFLYGRGKGGCVTALKFHPTDDYSVFTTSIDGTVKKQDFRGVQSRVFLDTMNYEKWWTSLDVSPSISYGASTASRVVVVGNNTGGVVITDLEGRTLWVARLHKAKVQDIEFNPFDPHYFVTAGNDKVVRVWDIRFMQPNSISDSSSSSSSTGRGGITHQPVTSFTHNAPLNASNFSPTTRNLLLTTAQDSSLHLFDTSTSSTSTTPITSIYHPHRHFQHITPIKATWHPTIPNTFAIGRYPDPPTVTTPSTPYQLAANDSLDQTRSIDTYTFNPHHKTISLGARMSDTSGVTNGIMSIVKFSIHADREVVASASGFTSFVWDFVEKGGKKGGYGVGVKKKGRKRKDDDEDEDDEDANKPKRGKRNSGEDKFGRGTKKKRQNATASGSGSATTSTSTSTKSRK